MAKKSLYKKRAKALKALGLLPDDFDLRFSDKTLSPALKGLITRRYNHNSDLVENPQFYKSVLVSAKTAKRYIGMSYAATQRGTKTRLFMPVAPSRKLRVEKGRIVSDNGFFKETIFPVLTDIEKEAAKIFPRLKHNEYLMLKVGNRGPIKEVLHDLEHLHRYLQDWKPKHTAKWSKEDLISQMSIVQVSERHYMQDGDTPEERKQIARARYEREAPRKAYRQEIRRQKEAKKNRSN